MKITAVNLFLNGKGLGQVDICRKLDLHKSTVSLLLAGKIHLPHRLDQIAEMAGVSRRKLDTLIEEDRRKAAEIMAADNTEKRSGINSTQRRAS